MQLYDIFTLFLIAALVIYLPVLANRGKSKSIKRKSILRPVISESNLSGLILFFTSICYSVFYVYVYFKENLPVLKAGLGLVLLLVCFVASIYFYKDKKEQI